METYVSQDQESKDCMEKTTYKDRLNSLLFSIIRQASPGKAEGPLAVYFHGQDGC